MGPFLSLPYTGVSDELKKELQSSLQELGKVSSAACRVIMSADQALLKMDDTELLEMNLNKLKTLAQEGEEVSTLGFCLESVKAEWLVFGWLWQNSLRLWGLKPNEKVPCSCPLR